MAVFAEKGEDARDGLVAVRTVSIDGWRTDTGDPLPWLIKFDVGGAETAAEGRTRSDPSEPPVLLVEVHEMVGPSFAEHFEGMLRPLGYGATSLTGGPMPMSNERFHVLLQPKQST